MSAAVAEETSQAPETEQDVAEQEPENVESSDVANDATSEETPDDPARPKLSRLERLELHQRRIRDAEETCREAEGEWVELKHKTKDAKDEFDSAVEYLRSIIREDPNQYELPFPAEDATKAEASGEQPADESWRAVNLSTLGISGKLLDILVENDLDTIGKISDHTSAGKQLTDISGIGQAKAELIENALVKYWEQNQRSNVTETTEATGGPLEDEDDDEDEDEDVEF